MQLRGPSHCAGLRFTLLAPSQNLLLNRRPVSRASGKCPYTVIINIIGFANESLLSHITRSISAAPTMGF